jgi:23S rRNA (uracil1939-C5)-methyltransferase
MLTPGAAIELTIEKPAAGGRMIARAGGQVVFVSGAIPGERVRARVDRVERQLAFAAVVDVLEASPDRREPFADPLCGGVLYAHVAYARQLRLKAEVVQDAFRRLGRLPVAPVDVAGSPEHGYRMRARFHLQGGRLGFYREGSHTICDAAATRQMRDEAVAAASRTAEVLRQARIDRASIELTENLAADQLALHVELPGHVRLTSVVLEQIVRDVGPTGISARAGQSRLTSGSPLVADPLVALTLQPGAAGLLQRSATSFFQANRFLLPSLVRSVIEAVPAGPVLDLYAGVGLFSIALAAAGRRDITAVEGDPSGGGDLRRNAAPFGSVVRVVLGSVERHLERGGDRAETVILDPPRTGISRGAIARVAALRSPRLVYVSCDPATMARDVRRLVDAGYRLDGLRAFDLFPNTPHVECLGVLTRTTSP